MTNWTPVEPLTDGTQDAAFWEPWTPKVGDRVRVRLNGECQIEAASIDVNGKVVHRTGHAEWMNNAVGGIVVCPHTSQTHCDRFPGHPYVVEYPAPDGRAWWGHFAAIELEPLS